MDPERPVQTFEEPFDVSDFNDFDDDNDTTMTPASSTEIAEPFGNMLVDGHNGGYDGRVDAGVELPQFVNMRDLQIEVPLEAVAGGNGLRDSVAGPSSSVSVDLSAMDLGLGDVDMVGDPFGNEVDNGAMYDGDFNISSNGREWDMADILKDPSELDAIARVFAEADAAMFPGGAGLVPTREDIEQLVSMSQTDPPGWNVADDFQNTVEEGAVPDVFAAPDFAGGADLTPSEQEIEQVAEIWEPVSTGLELLNSEFTPQPEPLAADESLRTMALMAAEGNSVHAVSEIQSMLRRNFPWKGFEYSRRVDVEITQTASDDHDDGGVVMGAESTRRVSSMADVQAGTYDDTVDAEGETDTESVPNPSAIQNPQSAHASSSGPSIERREEHDRRQTNGEGVSGKKSARKSSTKAPSRCPRKLLKEIEDTKGFAGAKGVVDGKGGRPMRRGARKCYEGLE